MRLLTVGNMYPPQHLGGYEVVWAAAVEHLRARGHEVSVLTTDTRLREQAQPDPSWVHRDLHWHWRDHVFTPASGREAERVERHNADILRSHLGQGPDAVMWWSMGGLSLALLEQVGAAGVPAGAVVHDAWPIYGPRVDPRTASGASRFATEAIARWSFNSAALRDAVLDRVAEIPADRCSVESPGIDTVAFEAPPPGDWEWRLACVGRVEPTKGLAVAIEALGTLPDQTRLTIAGGGDDAHRAELEALAGQLGLRGRAVFTGALPDVVSVYAGADAVLFPVTWEEPFGLVPLEAMAAGRPVLATGTGGSAEYLRDGVNCLLSPPGDAAALAAAITRLAGDPELRARLVAGGHATAQEHPATAFNDAMERVAEEVAGVSGDGRGQRAGT